jgi:N-acetylmuramoyl-L-alanine amidase
VIAAALVAVVAALPLAGTTIHVDAGHNGANGSHPAQINRQVPAGTGGYRKACDTTGAQTNDGRLTEATFNLDVARRLQRRLARLGARVVMTRTTNDGVGPCVNERAAIGNRAHADLALSIHADGGPPGGRGFHVIAPLADRAVRPAIVAPSRRFARALRARLEGIGLPRSSYIGEGAGLVQRADLGGLNLSRVPKAFVELGNMRNAADARLLERASQRDLFAVALARAVVAALRPGGTSAGAAAYFSRISTMSSAPSGGSTCRRRTSALTDLGTSRISRPRFVWPLPIVPAEKASGSGIWSYCLSPLP